MAISRDDKPIEAEVKSTFYRGRHFKRVFSGAMEGIKGVSYKSILLILVLITGIGELIGSRFDAPWWVLIFTFIILANIREIIKSKKEDTIQE